MKRQSIRLKGYDYTQDGAYFVTVCTHEQAMLFGDVVGGEMGLNDIGRIVRDCWLNIPDHFDGVKLDEFVVMPDHIHGIIDVRRGNANIIVDRPVIETFGKPVPGSIPTIIRSFKSAVTNKYHARRGTACRAPTFGSSTFGSSTFAPPITTIWQRNYHEHIIRNGNEWSGIRDYIRSNPEQWTQDDLHRPIRP